MAARPAALRVEVSRSTRASAPVDARLARWARAALGRDGAGRELSLRVVGQAESRALNRRYRGQDKPTNVLAFPAPVAAGPLLGDLVVCAAVVSREAREQGKPVDWHWAHMIVHGCLHLAGLDHLTDAEARVMERRETRLLAALGIPDPYRPRALAAERVA